MPRTGRPPGRPKELEQGDYAEAYDLGVADTLEHFGDTLRTFARDNRLPVWVSQDLIRRLSEARRELLPAQPMKEQRA